MASKKYAFYGTLRLNQPNYKRLLSPQTAKFLGQASLSGYTMFNLGAYPIIVELSDTTYSPIKVDLFEITDEYSQRYIHLMELGAGYQEKTTVIDGEEYIVYYAPFSQWLTYYGTFSTIRSGDWVQHISKSDT